MKRIYYIDWLRILAILAVFFFHASHFFDPFYWHVKNPQQSNSVLLFLAFLNIWIMPLFFFLSGASSVFGIRKPFRSFVTSKTTRLLIPLIMGVLLLIPPQKYVEALSHQMFSGGYFEFLKEYFTGGMFNQKIGFSPLWIGVLSYHLWFLGHLLIISVVLFPAMRWITSKGDSMLNVICKITSFNGGALFMFIPIAIVRVILKKHFPDYTGWCDLSMYSLFFLLGFIYTHHEGLKQTLIQSRYAGLLTGFVLYSLYMISFSMKETPFGELFQNYKVYGYYVFQESAGAFAAWSWIVFIVATGMKYLNGESKYRQSLNEAVLPFYILHQTVLLLIGYVVVQWSWCNWGKFCFIAVSSLFTILIIYMFGVKPFNIIRFLFGMGKRQKE
jgi:glucans biosynthesis protein C